MYKTVRANIYDVVVRRKKRHLMVQIQVWINGKLHRKYIRFLPLPCRWDDLIARVFIEEKHDEIEIQDNLLTEFNGDAWI